MATAIGSATLPVYIDANGVPKKADNPKNAALIGTDANGNRVSKSLSTSTTSDTWTFEALDGATTNKTIVTGVTISVS